MQVKYAVTRVRVWTHDVRVVIVTRIRMLRCERMLRCDAIVKVVSHCWIFSVCAECSLCTLLRRVTVALSVMRTDIYMRLYHVFVAGPDSTA
jgi:hypothetical protein